MLEEEYKVHAVRAIHARGVPEPLGPDRARGAGHQEPSFMGWIPEDLGPQNLRLRHSDHVAFSLLAQVDAFAEPDSHSEQAEGLGGDFADALGSFKDRRCGSNER
jgi:hypothetical protein